MNLKDNEVTAKNIDEDDDDTFDVNPKVLLIFVVLMCIMLVSLYFLYDYLGKCFVLFVRMVNSVEAMH